jgi:hypothetical protein
VLIIAVLPRMKVGLLLSCTGLLLVLLRGLVSKTVDLRVPFLLKRMIGSPFVPETDETFSLYTDPTWSTGIRSALSSLLRDHKHNGPYPPSQYSVGIH